MGQNTLVTFFTRQAAFTKSRQAHSFREHDVSAP